MLPRMDFPIERVLFPEEGRKEITIFLTIQVLSKPAAMASPESSLEEENIKIYHRILTQNTCLHDSQVICTISTAMFEKLQHTKQTL